MPRFRRFVGIDYSGAQTPTSSLPGLRVYLAESGSPSAEVAPPSGPRKHWTRRGVAEWLVTRLREPMPTIVGIDHGFSFPLSYFERHRLSPDDWPAFLDDFQAHWPTDSDHLYVDFVREGRYGDGKRRMGDSRWRRLTEIRAGAAKSVFHFDVQGQVAKSTHSGLPWLRYIRRHLGAGVHFWPFDGWAVPDGGSAIAEVYPALWSREFPREARGEHQHDAYAIAEWMRRAHGEGALDAYFSPPLTPAERATASIEGWILGVMDARRPSGPASTRVGAIIPVRQDRPPAPARPLETECYDVREDAMATTTRRVATEEDLLAMPKDGRKYELVDGEIRMSPAGDRHSVVALELAARLLAFAKQHRLGHVLGADAGFRLPSKNVRSPDVSFVAAGRFPDDKPPVDFGNVAPDLAVEVLSPHDRPRYVLDKIGEYLEAGVHLIWIIDPQRRRAIVYRSLSDVHELGEDGLLDGQDLLPGFRCVLRDILI